MSTEILVNISHSETRAALVEGGAVQEVFVQRAARHGRYFPGEWARAGPLALRGGGGRRSRLRRL